MLKEFFNKILCKKRRYFGCDTRCSSGNQSLRTKPNDEGSTNKVQKNYNIKHQCLMIKAITFSEMNSRAQADIINMQSQPDRDLKWIILYQDPLTKFVPCRPVKSKRAPEIACQLRDIFSILGVPSILQSDNGREFVNSVITKLSGM